MVVEIDFSDIEEQVVAVQYVDDLLKFGMTILGGARPEEVLACKTFHWSYEKEYRIVDQVPYFEIPGRVKRVILGIRAPEDLELLLTRVLQPNVTITRARLDHDGVCVQPGEVVRQGIETL